MSNLILRVAANALGLYAADALLDGLTIDGTPTLLVAAILLALVNAVVKPVLVFFTLPLTILTLGLFLFVVNGLMLALVAALLPRVHLAGLVTGILAWLVVSVAGWVVGALAGGGDTTTRIVVVRQ